jgi:hypothetical protein
VREGSVILVNPSGPRLPLIARQLLGALRLVALTVSSIRRRWTHPSNSRSRTAKGVIIRRSRADRS